MAAPSAVILFAKNLDRMSIVDLVGASAKLALITNAWTPDASVTGNSLFADMSANEIAAGNGYTAGGVALTSPLATAITNGFKYSTANGVWTAAGGAIPAWRYGVIYVNGTLWGRVNPVIGYFLGDSAPADVPATTSGNTLTLTPNAAGWFDLAR